MNRWIRSYKRMKRENQRLVKHNNALMASNKLLLRCFEEATEDRDRYKAQLDDMENALVDFYEREKVIKGYKGETEH